MKKILIAILVVILLIFAYNQYQDYQRFHPKQVNYTTTETVDLNYHNQDVVYNYYEAIEELNHYIISQWTVNRIDVRNPENDDVETEYASKQYAKKLARVKFYEGKLTQSHTLKKEGLANKDIKLFEEKNLSSKEYKMQHKALAFKAFMFENLPKNNLFSGQTNAFVYEMQKLLVKKGYNIPVDGVYKNITSEAIKDFETKNNLFADGIIDRLTLEALFN